MAVANPQTLPRSANCPNLEQFLHSSWTFFLRLQANDVKGFLSFIVSLMLPYDRFWLRFGRNVTGKDCVPFIASCEVAHSFDLSHS